VKKKKGYYILSHLESGGFSRVKTSSPNPFLAVALSPTREVSAVAYDTRQEAEAHIAALATEAARAKPSDDQDV
jgi:hypothetical protein